MAHIIGLTERRGRTARQVMVNADHMIYWHATGPLTHPFKPYADDPHICVTELPNGETCNAIEDDHDCTIVQMTGGLKLHVTETLHVINERIDVIQAALETWTDNE
jgi:hypothetical protein